MNKKIWLMGILLVLVLVQVTLAEDNETNNSTNITKPIVQPKVTQTYDSGSFYIAKNKTILGLRSNYDGFGFGVIYSYMWTNRDIYFRNHFGFFRDLTMKARDSKRLMTIIHQKLVPTRTGYDGYTSLYTYEFLTNAKNISYIDYTFTVPRTVNPDNVYLIYDNSNYLEISRCQNQNRLGYTLNYVSCRTDKMGLITIAEGNVVEVPITLELDKK